MTYSAYFNEETQTPQFVVIVVVGFFVLFFYTSPQPPPSRIAWMNGTLYFIYVIRQRQKKTNNKSFESCAYYLPYYFFVCDCFVDLSFTPSCVFAFLPGFPCLIIISVFIYALIFFTCSALLCLLINSWINFVHAMCHCHIVVWRWDRYRNRSTLFVAIYEHHFDLFMDDILREISRKMLCK